MRALLLTLTLLSLSARARTPVFDETFCAHALSSLSVLPLIQPEDLRAQVDGWNLPEAVKTRLKADLDDPRVLTRAASVKGAVLDRFAMVFGPGLEALDTNLAAYREVRASGFVPTRRLAAGAATLALGSLAMMSLGEHWVFQTLGLGGLIGAGGMAWTAYFHSSYAGAQSLAAAINRLAIGATLGRLRLPDGEPNLSDLSISSHDQIWLNSRLVAHLNSPRPVTVPLASLDRAIETNRRWPFEELVPGRTRVMITMYLGFDESGDKRLTIVARLKRPFRSARPR